LPAAIGIALCVRVGIRPRRRCADGDPVDAMVLAEVPTLPDVVIASRPLGVIRLEQDDRERRERIPYDRTIAVPVDALRLAAIQTQGERLRCGARLVPARHRRVRERAGGHSRPC
jgi:inorganic pyrophosphatase